MVGPAWNFYNHVASFSFGVGKQWYIVEWWNWFTIRISWKWKKVEMLVLLSHLTTQRVCASHLNKIHVSSQISKILVF